MSAQRTRTTVVLAVLAAALLLAPAARASTELVKNGLRTDGASGQPKDWRHNAYSAAATSPAFPG